MTIIPKVCRAAAEKIQGYRAFKEDHLYLLERIERRGAERQALVKYLALAATASDNRNWWREAIRGRIADLRNLSRRLEIVSHDATKLLNDPWCRVEVWRSILGGFLFDAKDPTKK